MINLFVICFAAYKTSNALTSMVKIFIGNLPQQAEVEELKSLFTQYGAVTECAIIKNFAFVHMDDRKSATKAIKNLHLYKLHGTPINVEASRGKNQGPVKLHVANVEKGSDEELRTLFEEYGTVTECAIIKNFAFVHMNNSDEAMDALRGLDNSEFKGWGTGFITHAVKCFILSSSYMIVYCVSYCLKYV